MTDPVANVPVPPPARPAKKRPKGSKRTKTVEEQYRALIKAGHVRIVRRRGKPPEIIWL